MLVEPSATMRYVLKNFTDANGYETDGFTSFEKAKNALKRQFEVFDTEYRCVMIGWPSKRDRDSEAFLQLLESPDFHDLPVIVLSQDLRADARAWVAGRNHTVLVRWKEYRSVKALLTKQLDQDFDTDSDAFQSKFSNQDIRILVVDDSPSIRYALRDLLKLQGYEVSVVGSYSQGIQAAREGGFDIAVLDYYLQDATGDELCREIIADSQTGDVTCTILTGTYSDHIIKRSLRAGAVECMFKNESSELLLARIDAISRMVRQRKELQINYLKMDVVIDSLNGAVLSYDDEGVLRFSNTRAMQLLGYTQDDEFIGHHIAEVLTQKSPERVAEQEQEAMFYNANRQLVKVLYTSQDLIEDGRKAGTVLKFKTINPPPAVSPSLAAAKFGSNALMDLKRYASEIQGYLDLTTSSNEQHSLLLISTGIKNPLNGRSSIKDYPDYLDSVLNLLAKVYKRENSLAYLGGGVVGIILEHKTDKQAYLLTRKFMQIINTVSKSIDNVVFVSNGCLAGLESNTTLSAPQLLSKAKNGLKVVESRGDNLALIYDLKRLLPAYPKK
jgi:DNA-binding response OmpR family regulator